MGFQEGAEDESLLTCIVCQSPFGMTARFCGDCGANREQALGIERAKPSQRIRAVEPLPAETRAVFQQPVDSEPVRPFAQEIKRRKPSKLSNARVNMAIRLEHLWFTFQYHGKKIVALGLILFIGSGYAMTQSLIFLHNSPADVVSKYVAAVSTHDTAYFAHNPSLTPDQKNTPFLPTKFNVWDAAQTASWINTYAWNGWMSSGSATLEPGANEPTVYLTLEASSKGPLGIFRDQSWSLSGAMATVTIKYPSNPSLPIYINNIYAGTVGNPSLPEGTYYAMPGPFVINFASQGKTNPNDVNIFIDSRGKFEA